ncbi:Multidrug resistance protein MdtC [Grimontia celer]|uniref:Multidrug resistance protein MdtC n=1 Tax=Grimontia celer TaxID=1796497 RepID=A0A128F256_9GAMM|nr:efflux RND transporter permease subunit [Grimontia celer]CZF80869.1 Multidrug resistance protein MdtC [Grimontia celer]
MKAQSPLQRYFDSKMGYIILMLLITLCGLAALKFATLTSFPYSRSSSIFVSAQFFDKPAKYIATHVASDIEDIFASQDGLEYTRLTVENNALRVTGKFDKSVDIDAVARDISNALTNSTMVQNNLDELTSGLDEGDYAPDLGYVFTSPSRSDALVSRLLETEITPILRSLPGIQSVALYGPSDAIYIDIDQDKLNASGLALNQVYDAVRNAFTQPASYLVDGENYEIFHHKEVNNGIQKMATLRIEDSHSEGIHTLSDIADFRVANEYTRVKAQFNDKDGVVLLATFDGRDNPLSVAGDVKQMITTFLQNEPDLQAQEIMDSTVMLYGSIKETLISIILSVVVTCLIVYFTTRSAASALAISLSIPLSLLLAFAFFSVSLDSINLITITALIIAIGLVVDDSIVVTDYLQNQGSDKTRAGNRQLNNLRAIMMVLVAITLTLVVVYLPYIFSSADYSVVSKEFGLSISIALLCSLFVSVLVTPKLLPTQFVRNEQGKSAPYQNPVMRGYRHSLVWFAESRGFRATMAFALLGILAFGYLAWQNTNNEVAPPEDKRLLMVLSEVSPNATSIEVQQQANALTEKVLSLPWVESTNYVTGVPDSNMITHYVRLKEPEYETSSEGLFGDLNSLLQQFSENPQRNNTLVKQSESLASLLASETLSRSFVILPTDIPGASTFPIDIAVMGSDTEEILEKVEKALSEARATGLYEFLIHDAKYVSNQFNIETLVDTSTYGSAENRYFASLIAAFAQPNYIGKTPHANDNVKVYLGISEANYDRATPMPQMTWVDDYTLYDDGSRQIMKSAIQRVEPSFEPRDINKTNGLPSVQIRGITLSGANKYEAIETLKNILIAKGVPEHNITFLGSSRSISKSVTEHVQITLFSLVLIFLLLTVLFDSLIAPIIIMISTVPITYFSGYIALDLFGLSDNIYTRLSILTAVGLSSKQAVIMVYEVLRLARENGQKASMKEAIIQGCSKRFNAVFMTSFSLILGVLPLIFQFNFGAVAKYNIAVVIVFCMTISFITVLYFVPLVMLSLPKTLYRGLLFRKSSKQEGDAEVSLTQQTIKTVS